MLKGFATSDGARLAYEDSGEGEVLILLHGWSQSAAMFRHQVAHFSARRRVVAPDFRGHGLSPAAVRGYRIHRFAADVAELMDHEGIARASVLGWSLGASVTWAFVDLYGTARLDRLILVDEPACLLRQAGMSDEEAADAGAVFDAAALERFVAGIAGPDGIAAREAVLSSMVTRSIPDELRAFLLAENLKAEPRAMASLFAHHASLDWRDVFDRIDRPTLVTGGRVSHIDPRSQRWISRQIPGADLALFDEGQGGAHFPFIEQPDTFNEVIGRFLDRPRPAAAA